MQITVGHTPDADDAFMFYGMLSGKIPSPGFEIAHVVEDIEALNCKALSPSLDVTAVSAHACAFIPGYTILRSGGSFGLGYGPIVTTKMENSQININDLSDATIAIPGKMTSAFLLLQLVIGKFKYVEMNFAQIPDAVRLGKVDAGLVIHETQLSYTNEGIAKIFDVGRWWHDTTGGLPVPLGVNVIKSDLGEQTITKFDRYLRDSIQYGLDNDNDAIDYAMKYARGKPKDMINKFVHMYVNKSTVNMGDAGEKAINLMFNMASQRNLLEKPFVANIAPKL